MLACAMPCLAQNVKADIEKINKVYARAKYSLELEYRVFEYYSAEAPMQVENGLVKKDGELIYYKLGPVESIQQKDYSVITDHDDKIIALLPREYNATQSRFLPAQLDSLHRLCNRIEYAALNSTTSSYAFYFDGSQYELVKLFFHPGNFQISKMELFYKDAVNLTEEEGAPEKTPRMEIIYKQFDTNPSFAAQQFTYHYFLEKTGKDYKPKANYHDYTVVTQL